VAWSACGLLRRFFYETNAEIEGGFVKGNVLKRAH
jgi:hypothetical protein